MVTVSGLIYNLGLVVGPWFEGQLAQCLLGILNGNETFAAMAALCAGYLIAIAVVQGSRFIKRLYVRKFANNINRSMKQVLYANLVRKDKVELEQAGTGTLMTKAISDVDAWTHDGISAQPDIVPDGNFFPVFDPGIAGIRMDRMSGCIDRNIRSHLAVVTDFYFCDIQDRTVVIGIKIFPDFNMGAVIAVKRRIDPGIFGFP